jgi:hypothetical protein
MGKPRIPDGLQKEHVLSALHDLDQNSADAEQFGIPTRYFLIHKNRKYAPKAAIGLAFKYFRGTVLSPREFEGGKKSGSANAVLKSLGFTIHDKA